jgi:hypothetical protein
VAYPRLAIKASTKCYLPPPAQTLGHLVNRQIGDDLHRGLRGQAEDSDLEVDRISGSRRGWNGYGLRR